MTEDEAYKVHIQYTFNALCKIWILKTGGSGRPPTCPGTGQKVLRRENQDGVRLPLYFDDRESLSEFEQYP